MEALKRVALLAVLATLVFSAAFPVPSLGGNAAYAGEPVKLYVDGAEIATDVPPLLVDGVTLVPVRFVAEALGGRVAWDEETTSVFISGPAAIALQVGSRRASINGRAAELLHEPVLEGGRVLVPVRFVAEAFGCRVDWEDGRVLIWRQQGAAAGSGEDAAVTHGVPLDSGPPVDTVRVEWK